MKCPECSTENSAYETRCVRCGVRFAAGGNTNASFAYNFGTQSSTVKPFVISREPRPSQMTPNASTPASYTAGLRPGMISTESTARQIEPHTGPTPDGGSAHSGSKQSTPERPRLEMVPPGRQPSLFAPGDFTSMPASLRIERADATHGFMVPAKRKPARKRKKSDMLPFEQGEFAFHTPVAAPVRQLATSVEASVSCDRPVAGPMHRLLGAGWNAVAVLFLSILLGALFAGILYSMKTALPVSTNVLLLGFCAVTGLVAIAYHAFFVFCGWESPGWRAVGLRLVSLDGREPTQAQRWLRFGVAFVSLATAFIGLIWIWFEEERLSWHDSVSGTFPTPRIYSESSFHRH